MQGETLKEQLSEVGQRIKNMREILGISAESMAKNVEVSVADYREYESGTKDFSFTFIYKCAKCFDVDPTDLLQGSSPRLTSYEVTRKGGGLPITRLSGLTYKNLAPLFKNKIAEPYWVKIPYSKEDEENPVKCSSHAGQEFDIVIKGRLKAVVGSNTEILNPGDTIYYNSRTPHGLVALDGEDVEIYALVFNAGEDNGILSLEKAEYTKEAERFDQPQTAVYKNFIKTTKDENRCLTGIEFVNEDKFNFGFDVVDALAKKCPDKLAMLYISKDMQTERRFTFADISKYSAMTANYF
ncbi:MAG: cupin domain-containing protein, partial [Deferribacterales bacterium]|nr:cupin domain-containing protein [Deferribacterales bacterium]